MKLGIYQHYKGRFYDVIGIAKESDTYEDMVVYRGRYDDPEFGSQPLWVKRKDAFETQVEFEGKMVPRFTYIGN